MLTGICSAQQTFETSHRSDDRSIHNAKQTPGVTHHLHNKSIHNAKQTPNMTQNSNDKRIYEEILKPVKRFEGNFIAKKNQDLTLLISITSGPDNILRDAARYKVWYDVLMAKSFVKVYRRVARTFRCFCERL